MGKACFHAFQSLQKKAAPRACSKMLPEPVPFFLTQFIIQLGCQQFFNSNAVQSREEACVRHP